MAKIALLNGVSSAGKSTLARALQHQASFDLLHIAMDDFIGMLPDGSEAGEAWFPVSSWSAGSTRLTEIANGDKGSQLLAAMRAFVAEAARASLDMVIDEVCDARAIEDYRRELAGYQLVLVKVDAPLDALERRERARGDRAIGLARAQSRNLHSGIVYDLEINTEAMSPENAARTILERIG